VNLKKDTSLIWDFLDVKSMFKSLSRTNWFIFLFLVAIEFDSYLDLLLKNSVPDGTFGVLKTTYLVANNAYFAVGLDMLFTFGYLYLAFWFYKKGQENKDLRAYLFFVAAFLSPDWIPLFFGVD
jgi:hypothetical protein